MELQLVSTNYIFKNWIGFTWKILFSGYSLTLIILTIGSWETLFQYENEISIASEIILVSAVIIGLLNSFVYSNIGKAQVLGNILKVSAENFNLEIDLNKVETLHLEKVQNGIWKIRLVNEELEVKLTREQLNKLKGIIAHYNITQEHFPLIHRVFNWVKSQLNFT